MANNFQSGFPVPNPTRSYWLKDPSPLANHRTTPELPTHADTIVIGSGITGAFAAHFLKESHPDERILMLEAREVCSGATGRNGGHLQPLLFIHSSPAIANFELSNYFYLRDFIKTNDIDCDFVELKGGVHAFEEERQFTEAKALVERNKTVEGFPNDGVEVIDGDDGERLRELGVPGVKGVVLQRRAGSLWPIKLVTSILTKLCQRDGFNLQTNTLVTGVKKRDDEWEVVTDRGTAKAGRVVVATNAYTSALLPAFGDLIVPVRGQVSALIPPRDGNTEARLSHSYGINGAKGGGRRTKDDYMVQRPPGHGELIFGGERSHEVDLGVGNWDDSSISEDVALALRRGVIPPLELGGKTEHKLDATFQWTGIMGYSRGDVPWVGEVPASLGGGKGLFVCGGYTGHGMPNALLSAHAVVQMMVGNDEGHAFYALPQEYVLTEERVRRVRESEATVQDQQVRDWESLFATRRV
ncbi:hypothetical protein OQA88_11441 [Cercophora sp. LCS_1]